MKYTIYQITNLLNGKTYIGKHQTTNPNDSYYGSGIAISKSIIKHGKENFKKEVLFTFDTEEEMNKKEIELVNEDFVARDDTYNMGVGGQGGSLFKGRKHRKESKEKLSKTQKDPLWKERHTPSMKGRNHNEESRNKMAESQKKFYENNKFIRSGENGSQYGKIWISNDLLQQTKAIDKTSPIPEGWTTGRCRLFTNCWVSNIKLCKHFKIKKNETLPDDCVYGRFMWLK
jgi:hypothetical protein